MNWEEQLTRHPSMQPRDVVKLCYQAAFGAEHLLGDLAAAEAYFMEEYAAVPPGTAALCEDLSPEVSRVNFSAWKALSLPPEWLFRMFARSASAPRGSRALFEQYLSQAGQACSECSAAFPFSPTDWETFLAAYRAEGMGPVHHSREYRAAEAPAYRIVDRRLLRLLPILQAAAALPPRDGAGILAIDGRAASGKTTMARQLADILDGGIVHMDDFFLPQALRCDGRFAQPGGNVHYERFAEEVLPHLASGAAFSYRIFDCGTMDYQGCRPLAAAPWRIVEGAYSRHPAFGPYADLTVFSTVEPEEQLARICRRNGTALAAVFSARWIPMEEAYFAASRLSESAAVTV